MKTSYSDIPAYITKDGSEIRELLHPGQHGARHQSLAEATVSPGKPTQLHRHHRTEEIYHVTAGQGQMTLGEEVFDVAPGDSILIPPGTPHSIMATGEEALHIMCCCSPAYSHHDTELIDVGDAES
jgi:mannose-6-phosphate isomerase-like protein (cupin superfamily)